MGDPSAERLPEATHATHVAMGTETFRPVISGKETCPLIVRASRVKKVVANSAQSHQIQSYMRIST